MNAKRTRTDERIANILELMLKRLDALEEALGSAPKRASALAVEHALIREKLDRLTLKRHAVLTATLGDLGYDQIATLMNCDETTVKLHLRAALNILRIRDRSSLRAAHATILDSVSEAEYRQRYGVGKRWWLEKNPALLGVLRAKKPARNQYTK